jgi:hypothetical protein
VTENENEAVDPSTESDEVDEQPFEGDPDKVVPPSQQHVGLEEAQDDIDPDGEGEAVGDDLAEAEPQPDPPRLQNFGDADA